MLQGTGLRIMRDLIGEAWEDIRLHVEDELRSKNMARYEVWVSWFTDYYYYASDDFSDAMREFRSCIEHEAKGRPVEVRDTGKVIASAPADEIEKVSK